jgi:hypothetical protein
LIALAIRYRYAQSVEIFNCFARSTVHLHGRSQNRQGDCMRHLQDDDEQRPATTNLRAQLLLSYNLEGLGL